MIWEANILFLEKHIFWEIFSFNIYTAIMLCHLIFFSKSCFYDLPFSIGFLWLYCVDMFFYFAWLIVAQVMMDASDDSDSEDEDDTDEEDDEEEEEQETPKKAELGKKKRPTESVSKTPVPAKKAKLDTPQKTDGKKGGGHIATPHPAKQAGKTPNTSGQSKEKTPKSDSKVSCKSCSKTFNSETGLDSHTKAKHGGKQTLNPTLCGSVIFASLEMNWKFGSVLCFNVLVGFFCTGNEMK